MGAIEGTLVVFVGLREGPAVLKVGDLLGDVVRLLIVGFFVGDEVFCVGDTVGDHEA